MADRHAEIRKHVEKALQGNEAEREQLEKALLYLDTGITPSEGSSLRPANPKTAKPKRRRPRRAPRGQRGKQFLNAVNEKPGITVAEIARQIGVSPPNALYALAKKLVKQGRVVKSGAGYKLKTSTPKKAPAAKKPKGSKGKGSKKS